MIQWVVRFLILLLISFSMMEASKIKSIKYWFLAMEYTEIFFMFRILCTVFTEIYRGGLDFLKGIQNQV